MLPLLRDIRDTRDAEYRAHHAGAFQKFQLYYAPMSTLFWNTLRRSRPQVGWRQAILALAFALCPALAATDSRIVLPAGLFFWAGLLGLWLGMRAGRLAIDRRTAARPATATRPSLLRTTLYALRLVCWLIVILGFGALLAIAAGQALPPLGLITQDIAAGLAWVLAVLRRQAGIGDMPLGRVWEFLAVSLPRFWHNLLIAPSDSQRGAQLLVAAGGAVATWVGALALGWGLARRHSVFGWGTPMLAALMFTAILNGGSGSMLLFGLALLLVLAIVAGFGRRELRWDRTGTDYSDELGNDVLAWGAIIAGGLIGLALLLPTSLDNPLADLLWRDVELPSGIAELEKNIPRPKPPPPKVDVGLSTLPELELGQSLEQPPPSAVSLRVRLDAPFAPAPWPRYWRARVFNIYNGRGWVTNARIGPFDATAPAAGMIPGGVLQDIEDLRRNRTILIGLPDAFNISVPVESERLPDGSLAAVTSAEPARALPCAVAPARAGTAAAPRWPAAGHERLSGAAQVLRAARHRPGACAGRQRAYAVRKSAGARGYLRDLPYSYQVQPLPGGGDAVEQFLFDMRQGYCTYYASSMAVMARSLGIPARVAIGYATGEYDPATRTYIVHESDAHAWPELYINGQWLPFEPTPIRPLPARSVASAVPEPEPEIAAEPQSMRGPLIWVAVLAIIAAVDRRGVWAGPHPSRARVRDRGAAPAGTPGRAGRRSLADRSDTERVWRAAGAKDRIRRERLTRGRRSGWAGALQRAAAGCTDETRLRVMAERVWARLGRRRW